MRVHFSLLLGAAVVIQAQIQEQSLIWERATTVSAPDCSLSCLVTLVPEYCGSLTNVTCICTNTQLLDALTPCAVGACNITDALRLQRYSAETCGVPKDKSRVQEQLNVYYVLPAMATCFVAARVFIRTKLEVGLGADDWMMIAALAAYLTDVGTGLGIALYGFGQHTFWLEPWQVSKALMFFYISELFYLVAITLTKLSLLLFFRRIFPNQRLRTAIWVIFGFVIVSNLAILVAICFQCQPFHGAWTNWMYKVPPVKCIETFTAVSFAARLSIFHDLIILVLPIPTLWKLNLEWKKKVNLLIMFSVGSFVIMCSLLRLPSLMKLKSSSDPSYDQAPIAVWTNLEIGVGVVCGCLPAFRSLIGYLFPCLKMSLADTSDNPAYPAQPRSINKSDRRRQDSHLASSTRTFIELNDRNESLDELERGMVGSRHLVSQNSESPFHHQLVPGKGEKGYGRCTTKVNITAVEDPMVTKGECTGIMCKTTVEQTTHNMI